jgi:hypothetical protein
MTLRGPTSIPSSVQLRYHYGFTLIGLVNGKLNLVLMRVHISNK